MTLGEFIKKRREELDLTLEQIGNFVGVGKSTVSKWESGYICHVGSDKISRLAKILQVSPDVLISDDDNICEEKIKPIETSKTAERPQLTDDDIKVALFGGDKNVSDEMWNEVKHYIDFVKQRENNKK